VVGRRGDGQVPRASTRVELVCFGIELVESLALEGCDLGTSARTPFLCLEMDVLSESGLFHCRRWVEILLPRDGGISLLQLRLCHELS